jgi:hypothetical protein
MGIGDWGLGFGNGDWGLGPIPNPQSPIPNPQSPKFLFVMYTDRKFAKKYIIILLKLKIDIIKKFKFLLISRILIQNL